MLPGVLSMPAFHTDNKLRHEASNASFNSRHSNKSCSQDQSDLLKMAKDAQKQGFVKITDERERVQHQAVISQHKELN
eukprot:3498931-Rhodomonas_salina.1